MSSIQNISNAPKDTNVSLSYVGGLLFPGTSGNRLLMSYYIDWGITFNDSGEIHSTYDFVNYLLNKNIAISNNLQNCVDQVNALSQRVDDLSTTLSSNISSINTQLSSLSARIDKLEGNQTVEVTGISISNKISTLTVGSTHQLNVSISPANASNKAIIWSSSNSMCAEVSDSGLIKANGTGTVTITARSASNTELFDTCSFEVKANVIKVTKITVNQINTSNAITYGNSATATATIEPSNASNKSVTWKSNNTDVATINSSTGAITPVKAGTFTITATANDGSGVTGTSSTITVNKASQSLRVSANPSIIEIGGTTTATVSGNKTTPVTWSTSDANIADVNSSGLITGKGEGTATITATAPSNVNYNEGKGTVSIKVNKPAQPAETYYYYVGQTPITSSNYSTLAETTNTLLTSKIYTTEKWGKMYILVPNSVSSINVEQIGIGSWSSDSIIIDSSVSIPGHKVYVTAGSCGAEATLKLTFT